MPDTPPQKPSPPRRRNQIGSSPHKDEYDRLIEAGWTSTSLERYAAYRFGERIASTTFRQYKHRRKMVNVKPSVLLGDARETEVPPVDVMRVREELVQLQMARIAIDTRHEKSMSKLFSSTSREIDLLSKLLDQVKSDQRDYGILPDLRPVQAPERDGADPAPPPRARSLGEVLGLVDPGDVASAAEALAGVIPLRPRDERMG